MVKSKKDKASLQALFLSKRWLVGKRGKETEIPSDLVGNVTTDHITRIPDVLLLDSEKLRKSLFLGLKEWKKRVLKKGEYRILVAGESFGIGSSRETAAEAIKLNGFTHVFARSFGPIFLDNLINHGIYVSTNFDLLKRILTGEMVHDQELSGKLSEIQKRILLAGGLPGYIRSIHEEKEPLPQMLIPKRKQLPQTTIEKVMTRKSGEANTDKTRSVAELHRGDSVVVKANEFVGYDVFWAHTKRILERYFDDKVTVDEKHIWLFLDHFGASSDPNAVEAVKRLRRFWLDHPKAFRGTDGVYNKVMPRRLPVESVVVGTDSHTPELGVVPGLVPMPIGYTAFGCGIANDGLVPYTIPASIKLDFTGDLPGYCEIKDAIWHLVASYFDGSLGNGKMFEIGGEGYTRLPYEEACKLFNAVTEFGGIGAVGTELNMQVISYLRKHGTNLKDVTDETLERVYAEMTPDEGADYAKIIHFDLGKTEPALVGPHTHKKVQFLDTLKKPVSFDRVIYNSCAGSSTLDLAVLAEVLSDEKRTIPVDVHLADPLTREQADKLGILYELERSGVRVDVTHACGPCMGQGAFVKRGEVVLSTNNRNYPGRMGDLEAQVYLGSSVVAALTAKLGRVPKLSEVKKVEPLVYVAREKVIE